MVIYTYIIHIKILPCFSQVFRTFILRCAAAEKSELEVKLQTFTCACSHCLDIQHLLQKRASSLGPVYMEGLCTLVCQGTSAEPSISMYVLSPGITMPILTSKKLTTKKLQAQVFRQHKQNMTWFANITVTSF